MDLRKCFINVAVLTAVGLTGCQKKHDDTKSPPAPGPQTQTNQPSDTTKETPKSEQTAPDQKQADNNKSVEKAPNGQVEVPPPPFVLPTPPELNPDQKQDQLHAQDQRQDIPTEQQQASRQQADHETTWSDRVGSAKDYVKSQAQRLKDGTVDGLDRTSAMLRPSEDSKKRQEALDSNHSQAEEARQADPAKMLAMVSQTAPASESAVQDALQPNDETSSLLAALAVAPDMVQVNTTANRLVDEIFSEPELARAKVMKLQLGLRRLAESDHYDNSLATRVAFLQATLDQRIKNDEAGDVLKDGLFIAGTSLALGTVAGFHGFDGLRNGVRRFSPSEAWGASKSKIRSAWDSTKGVFRRGEGRGGVGRFSSYIRSVRLSSAETGARHLKALGLSDEAVSELGLIQISRREFPMQQFQTTNIPGFRYSVVNALLRDPESMGSQRVVFSLVRSDRGSLRPVYLSTQSMTEPEAQALVSQVRFRTAEEGGKDFMGVIDGDTGQVVGTRMTAEEVSAADDIASAKSVSEAQADGDIAPNPELVPEAEQSLKNRATAAVQSAGSRAKDAAQAAGAKGKAIAHNVVNGTREAVNGTVSTVRPVLKRFDAPWAATVAAGTAIPLYGFYYQGYDGGKRYGEGYQSLYLESLIPSDSLEKLMVQVEPDVKAN